MATVWLTMVMNFFKGNGNCYFQSSNSATVSESINGLFSSRQLLPACSTAYQSLSVHAKGMSYILINIIILVSNNIPISPFHLHPFLINFTP